MKLSSRLEEEEEEDATNGASVNVVLKDSVAVVVDAVVVVVVVVGKVVGEGTAGGSRAVTENKNMLKHKFCSKPCNFFRMISPRTVLISSQ